MQHKHWGGTGYEDISSNGAPLALLAVATEEHKKWLLRKFLEDLQAQDKKAAGRN